MHRHRSALSVSAVAALLLGAPLLTGCGEAAHPGAAAVVDGQRITVGQVQSRAEEVRDAQRAEPESAQLIQSTGPLARYTLNGMIRQKVVERAAEEEGVRVTRRDVQEFRAERVKEAGDPASFRARMLQERAVAPGQIDEVLRMDLMVLKIAESLGVDLNSPDAGEVMDRTFVATAEDMGIDISPRFGEWSNEQVSLTGSQEPWLKAAPEEQQPA
ncbi:SurA N-terminal domain-containing protein [Streptomyces sp. 549]|uniref:SurA N-terminal domain-containing protein n=1 Tax=Streptomyces sp. 549 TaxID=3049076 RepID=UPI0024C2C9A7|nr:SurA N-terminal domain-containing protein [Streptomyces sp. 549]MDK1475973.1 SurA N-terminal domain-containing protein [Streptomyces sp. 549]